jgi:hypothetical protein
MLAVCLFGIGAAPALAHEGKTARNFPSRGANAYVLSRTGGNSSMNVSIRDLNALQSRFSDDFLWFRRSGKEYLISDRAVIDEAERCFDSLRTLRPEQEELARRDRALDREEEALDRENDALADADEAEPRDEGRLDERRRDIETRLRALEEQQRELDRKERILDEREEVLEKEAESRLDLVIDDALRRGLARPLTGR